MRKYEFYGQFKKDYKRVQKQAYYNETFEKELWEVVYKLARDIPLEEKYKDHQLNGQKKNVRECHLRPNCLLVYSKDKEGLQLLLMRIGPHNKALKRLQ